MPYHYFHITSKHAELFNESSSLMTGIESSFMNCPNSFLYSVGVCVFLKAILKQQQAPWKNKTVSVNVFLCELLSSNDPSQGVVGLIQTNICNL